MTDDHYRKSIEPITVIEAWDLGFLLGNVVKYIARHKDKGDEAGDLLKAENYLHRVRTGQWLTDEPQYVGMFFGHPVYTDEGCTTQLREALQSLLASGLATGDGSSR